MTLALVAGDAPVVPHEIPHDRLLRLSQVKDLVGLGKTSIYDMIKANCFPAPCKPGGTASRWSQNEVLEWLAHCVSRKVN
jgi:prophage regulatory protein